MTATDILARLKTATEPDRQLDSIIDVHLRVGSKKMQTGFEWVWKGYPAWTDNSPKRGCSRAGDYGTWWKSDRFTASIDAALALVERMLPGSMWSVEHSGTFRCILTPFPSKAVHAYSKTPALAILKALFTALEAKEAGETN